MTIALPISTLNAAPTPLPGDGEFDPIFAVADFETVTVELGESVLSIFAPFAFLANGYSGVTLNNSGNISSLSGDGVVGNGDGFTLDNSGTGYIAAAGDAVISVGSMAQISNAGTIIAGNAGINAMNGDATITNTGTIFADVTGISVSNYGGLAGPLGLVPLLIGTTVTNSGFIAGQFHGVRFDGTTENSVLNNSGVILSQDKGVSVLGINTTIINSGDITGFIGIYLDGDATVTNTTDGYIAGPEFVGGPGLPLAPAAYGFVDAIYGDDDGVLNLTNDGEIFGNIDLAAGTGNDVIVNNGVITGNVLLGGGDDMFTAGAGSLVLDNPFIIGEESLTAATAFSGSYIDGGAGNDTIYGHSQDEIILGGADEDFIKGKGGNDYLDGGSENDKLVAGGGDDTLYGGSGDDRLVGNQGNNVMIGGEGADRMRAGSGIDTFVWNSGSESGTDAATSDVVLAFEVGVDKLDFQSSVDGQLYFSDFGDLGAFGDGYLFVTDDGTDSFVSVDVEGDGVVDMIIELKDTLGLTVNDFVGASDEIFV